MYVKFVVKVTLPEEGTPAYNRILADMEEMLIPGGDRDEISVTAFIAHRRLMGDYPEYAQIGRTLVTDDDQSPVGYVG